MDIKDFMNNNKKLIIGIIVICLILLIFIGFRNDGKEKISIVNKNIEAGKNVDVSGLVKLKDKYKDTYVIEPLNKNVNCLQVGKKTISYILREKGSTDKEEVKVDFNVVDTTPPIIKELDILSVPFKSKFNITKFIEAEDNIDGKLSEDKIKVEGNVNTTKIGKYSIKVTAEDSSGNKSVKNMDIKVIRPYAAIEKIKGIEGKYINKSKNLVLSFYDNYGRASYSFGETGDSLNYSGHVSSIQEKGNDITLLVSYDTSDWQNGEKPEYEFAQMKLYKSGNDLRLRSFLNYKNIDLSYAGKNWNDVKNSFNIN